MGCGASTPAQPSAAAPSPAPAPAPAPAPTPAAAASTPAPTDAPAPAAADDASSSFLDSIMLGDEDKKKVEKINVGELKHLKDNADDMATVQAVFEACDADGNGEIDLQEMVERYGKQAGHMLKEFDLDEGKTISKDEFIAVLDAKYAKDAVRTAKWVKYLSNPPKGKPKKERLAEAAETEAWIANIALGEQETSKVEKIKIGELKHLKDNAEDMATVDAVFAACDADSNGEIDSAELVARYGKQAGHLLKEFDLDEGNTISKDEFIAVLDAKYAKDPVRTAKWVKYLSSPPQPKLK